MEMTMRKQTKQWTTKAGHKIRLCDMSDDHLCNTIKMLVRRGSATMIGVAGSCYMYAAGAPEMAAVTAEAGADELMDAVRKHDYSIYCGFWSRFMLEAERRGIDLVFKSEALMNTVECWRCAFEL